MQAATGISFASKTSSVLSKAVAAPTVSPIIESPARRPRGTSGDYTVTFSENVICRHATAADVNLHVQRPPLFRQSSPSAVLKKPSATVNSVFPAMHARLI